MGARPVVQEVADGVIVATGTHVAWVLVLDGDEVTLVDAGYLGDSAAVLTSLEYVRPRAPRLSAVVLTHAHVDHLGAAHRLHAAHGVPVLAHRAELPHVRGEVIEQATTLDVVRRAWRPRVARWAVSIARAGAPRAERIADPVGFDAGAPLDVPGGLVPVPTPGHTSGHCSFHLPERGVLIAGDALCTGHPVTTRQGPQLPPDFFQHDPALASASLDALAEVPADVVVPGHGPVFHGSPARMVELARGSG